MIWEWPDPCSVPSYVANMSLRFTFSAQFAKFVCFILIIVLMLILEIIFWAIPQLGTCNAYSHGLPLYQLIKSAEKIACDAFENLFNGITWDLFCSLLRCAGAGATHNKNLSGLFSLSHRPKHSSEHVAMKICCRFVIFGPGKLRKRSLKVLEKSWNLFGLMVYEPWT